MLANKGQTTENPQGGVHPSDGGIHWDDRGNWFLNIYELVSPSLSHEQVWDKINQDYQATRADGVQLQDQLERMSVDEPEENTDFYPETADATTPSPPYDSSPYPHGLFGTFATIHNLDTSASASDTFIPGNGQPSSGQAYNQNPSYGPAVPQFGGPMGTSEGVWPHYINYNFAAQQLQLEDNNQFSPGQHAQGYPRLPPPPINTFRVTQISSNQVLPLFYLDLRFRPP